MELGEVYVKIGADIVPLEKALGKARTVTKKTTEQMRAQMKTLGTGMVIAGAAITAAFALTVKSAINFQKQLAQVSTMLDKSAMKIMPQYKKGLLDMSVAFGESTDTLSRGLYDILSASIPPAKALEVLEVAATAATAGITDTGVAADAITTILNSYGMQAEDAGKVSDILFAVVKRGKLTFDELAPAIGKSAALASQAGLSFEDLGATIATLTRAGIRTDEAMTSVNGVLRAFLKPTDDAKKAAKEFGLELNTNTLRTIGMTGVMEKLTDATAEQLAAIFPNIRGLKGMAAALGDAEGYAEDYALMLNSAGLTQEAFAKQSATLGFKIEQLKKSFNVIAVTIGDALIPVIQSIVVSIGKVTAVISKWMDENPKLTATLVKLGAALGVFTMAGGLLILGALYVTNLKIALIGMAGTIKMVIPAIAKLSASWATLGTVSVATNTTIAQGTTPLLGKLGHLLSTTTGAVGLFVIAITGIVLGLKKWQEHSEKIREENEKLKASLLSVAEVANRITVVTEKIKDLEKQAEITGESIFLAGDVIKKQIKDLEVELKALRNEIGEGIEIVDEFAQSFADKMLRVKMAVKEVDWETFNLGMTELNRLAEEGKISASGLYKAMRELAIKTGVATDKTAELESEVGGIVTSVKDLTSSMELMTKEHEAYGKSVEDNVQYYTKMAEKLDEVEVILKTELMLLEEGTEEYKEKWKEILENAKAINTMKEALDELIEPLVGLELIAAKMTLLGDSIGEIPAKLGLLQEKAVLLKEALDKAIPDTKAWWEAKVAFEANQEAIDNLAESFDEFGEKGEELLGRLIELSEKAKKLKEALDNATPDTIIWEEAKIRYNAVTNEITALITELNNLEREQREAEQAARDLADAYKTITDKIYELTHTPMEVQISKLDQQKQAYIDLGVEIGIVNEWYDLQIAKLQELNPELDETTEKLKEAGEAAKGAGILGGEGWDNFTTSIKKATVALTNFTKEGVAAAIATIKMKFFPIIADLINDINNMTGIWKKMAEANLASIKKTMNDQINVILYGLDVYNEELKKLGGTTNDLANTTSNATNSMVSSWNKAGSAAADAAEDISNAWTFQAGTATVGGGWASYQQGTPYVPKTGMALLHRGEAVTPANQNTYHNSFSPTVNLSVQGGGSPKSIAQEVENVLYDMGRQFKRRGFEIIPGRG